MKIHILNESKQSLGGGWTFIRNFKKTLYRDIKDEAKYIIVDTWQEADIILIPSASMALRDTVSIIKGVGKKIVLRLDNIPRNSRNRGAGTPRLYDMAQMADLVIYQSKWAREYLVPFVNKWGPVIYNGVDTEIFNSHDRWDDLGVYDPIVLYSRYNRDETKGWERAWYEYQLIHRETSGKSKLVIVGQFSDELRNYNFDFYNSENIEYKGVINDPSQMAMLMRGCDILLAPYFNDCYSNTIQEAMACGLDIRADISGGTPELLSNGVIDLDTMVTNYIKEFENVLL